ncbi:alanine--tRNA ligase [Actinomycetaceae bacterium WB03_NA08]|uniref:Alanine--tRNA ligase n=1 Tax=Scrofimicrobium canadense TaxID=2652290 RepID=A0A6N7W6Z3_9ACTO|nr:alanine--tRNA ligase [Scrofimicrobium canadense]MSS83928.1 alanine--tRNA ligase [Scrofimicrobium canadense]
MRTAEIRQRWLDYFTSNGHELRPSVSLISPDPSILFTIAGMVPFIPYITGEEKAPWPRAVSVQKCLRTNDIDNVGHTTRHGTFFQMNGNFSFGDYFKEGAIGYAWDLLTGSQNEGKYGLDGDRLWVTIWDEDVESFDILTKEIGLEPAHIVRLPRSENFWDTGQPGPAGPCCEWHYDRGPSYGPSAQGGNVDPGGDRYLELWNLVFDQYMRGPGEGKNYPLLHELDHKSIDTGAGLERIAFVLQDKPNMFEIDEVRPVITEVEEMTGRRYGSDTEADVRMRVVADHVRSSMMLISDGVRPGNDGRGYVLRRLIRRAVRSMRLLGLDEATMPQLFPVSRDAMAPSYPELVSQWSSIADVAYGEEDAFRRTLESGTSIFDTAVKKAKESHNSVLPGDAAFSLHDTYGFPIDLTLEMAAEKGVSVDQERFRALMNEQKERARADSRAKKAGHVDASVYHKLADSIGGQSNFIGYDRVEDEATIAGLLVGGEAVPAVTGPVDVDIILDQTPFYAESGGQLADRGTISGNETVARVNDVQAPIKGLAIHRSHIDQGTIALGDAVIARIDPQRRHAIAQAHTATHMVHKALHEIVSEQATQAGSENSPSRLRFDFRHGKALEEAQVGDIESLVNEKLSQDLAVTDQTMDLESAKALGAMALFGEKYGKEVRVVSIGDDWSRELCVGTHVPTTGRIGRITVLGEASIGSGVRRIDALVGEGAYEFQAREHALVSQLASILKGRPEELPEKISSLLDKVKDRERQISDLRTQLLSSRTRSLVDNAATIGDFLVVTANLGSAGSADALRTVVGDIRSQLGEDVPAIVAVIGESGGKPVLVAATNALARDKGIKAGALVKIGAGILGGGGGGKDDLAQGGGTDASKSAEALAAIESEIGRK